MSWKHSEQSCFLPKQSGFFSYVHKRSFSNSGINKVAMVKNALLPMSLYSLLCVNEIIRYHLHIVDRSTMCKWNHKVSFTHSRHEWGNLTNFNLACFFINVTIRECNFAMGTILGKGFPEVLSQDCPHGKFAFSTSMCIYNVNLKT